jgi:hypothetical protein
VQVASKEIQKISVIVQRLHHPDLHDESLRPCTDPVPGNNHHQSDAFCSGTPQHEQPDYLAPASPTARDLLRRLKRGHLLRYERDEDEQDATISITSVNLVDRIKREVRIFAHPFEFLSLSDVSLLSAFVDHRSGVWHLRG